MQCRRTKDHLYRQRWDYERLAKFEIRHQLTRIHDSWSGIVCKDELTVNNTPWVWYQNYYYRSWTVPPWHNESDFNFNSTRGWQFETRRPVMLWRAMIVGLIKLNKSDYSFRLLSANYSIENKKCAFRFSFEKHY